MYKPATLAADDDEVRESRIAVEAKRSVSTVARQLANSCRESYLARRLRTSFKGADGSSVAVFMMRRGMSRERKEYPIRGTRFACPSAGCCRRGIWQDVRAKP